VQTAHIGALQVAPYHMVSGFYLSMLIPTVEMVSGFKAVCITSGNWVALAMAGSGLRLPAIGIVASNYSSGDTAVVYLQGPVNVPVALEDATWSGRCGSKLYVGSGGMLVPAALMVSGQAWQGMGVATSGGVVVMPSLTLLSGGYTTPAGIF
jgi:hypothetical protein